MRTTTAVLTAALALVVAACGGSDGGGRSRSQAGKATGTINVWAWGNEGEILGEMTKEFEAENPGTKVNVTAVPVDAAHDKILTSVAGNQAPDVADGRHDVDGRVRADAARSTRRPASIDQSQFFKGARDTNVVDGKAYGVPWYVETRVLYYRTDIAEKAGITEAPEDLGRAQGDGPRDAGEGRRQVRHQPLHQQLAGVPAVRVAGRRRPRQGQRVHARLAAGRRGHRLLQVVLRRGPDARTRPSRASTSRPRSCAARTRCSSPARGTWA